MTLCVRCSYRELANPDDEWCEVCTREMAALRATSRPAKPAASRRRLQPLPPPERWPTVFQGARLDKETKGDERGARIAGAVDDAERLARRGPVAMMQAKMGGRGYAASLRGAEGSSGEPYSNPVFDIVSQGSRDAEAEITAALQLAVEGARLLRVARATIDRLVPEHPETVVVPIGSRPTTASACMVCKEIAGRLVRGMCDTCRSEWIGAGHPDVALWIAQRQVVDEVDEVADRRERRRASREAAVKRLAG